MFHNRFIIFVLSFILLFSTIFPMGQVYSASLQTTTSPIYFDLVLDEGRGWIYGSDSTGNKVDVISMATLELVKSFTLVNGATPKGIALSPDGSELAIAQNGASSILFLNPDTGATIATVVPNSDSAKRVWDVIYGRAGRLYASGSSGFDYIHVIDTTTHMEVSKSTFIIYANPYLAISSDKNSLFAVQSTGSPEKLYKFDVSTDTLPNPTSTAHTSGFTADTYLLLADDSKIFTDTGQVWSSDLAARIGSVSATGYLAESPTRKVVAIISKSTPGLVTFVKTTDYYMVSTYTIPSAGTNGPGVVTSDEKKLYVNTQNGMKIVDLDAFISLYSGSPQSTEIQKAFSNPFKVLVKDVYNNPIPGMEFTFKAPDSGASGKFSDSGSNASTVVSDANGIATSAVFTANEIGGSYTVKATAPGLISSVNFQLTNLPRITISGNAGINGVTLSYTDGDIKTVITNDSGNYSFTVPYNWSGTLTPSFTGTAFTPASRTYSNLVADQVNQGFSPLVTISGNTGTSYSTLSYIDGSPKTVTAGSNGTYLITVPYNWSGTVTPSKAGYMFAPVSKDYVNLQTSQTNQDYTATLLAYIISGNTGVGNATLTYYDGTNKTVSSNNVGDYSIVVPYSWYGTIVPTKSGYIFTPVSRYYSNVLADKPGENYAAVVAYRISGNVGIAGVTLTYVDGSTKSVTSDLTGNYSFVIPSGWAGTVTPLKTGYTFSPASRTYPSIGADQATQDYTANPILPSISGNAGMGGVTLSYYDGTPETVTTDNKGDYSLTVSYNWSGTITPSKPGYLFTPSSKSYSNVKIDLYNQNYIAAIGYNISGKTGVAGAQLSYTDDTLKTITSDSNGNYSFKVPAGWSGTVTPSKTGYIFAPTIKSYLNLQADSNAQDYTAIPLYGISGNVGAAGVTLSYLEGGNQKTVVADSAGYYSISVPAGWSGIVTPYKSGVIFDPTSKTYTNVQANQSSSDYIATFIVSTTADSGTGSLRQALANAPVGATIKFDSSLAGQTITLASSLTVARNVTIDGAGLNPRVEISGGDVVRIFLLDPSPSAPIAVNIKNVVLRNGKQTGLTYTSYGGAIFVDLDTNLTLDNVLIKNNLAYTAGAIYISPYANVTIINSEIANNEADQSGGAIYVNSIGILNLKNSKITGNIAISGGAIYFSGATNTSFIENNLFANNSAGSGGAIIGQLGNARIELRGNLFTGNQATNTYGSAGAVYFSASTIPTLIVMENNTFYNNAAGGNGGAAYLAMGPDVYLVNNTFSGNKASKGGNLYLDAGASVPRMYNNIIANSAGGGDCYAFYNSYTSGSNNLVGDGTAACLPSISGDPKLLLPADNGGPTQTMALNINSPALDAGTSLRCTATDQRGVARPQGTSCDIGAFEAGIYTLSITSAHGAVMRDPDRANYQEGSVVQLTATDATGWTFTNWSGDLTGTTNPASIKIKANTSVTANYTQNEYTLTVTSAQGTVTKSPYQATYHEGDLVQLTVASDAGWSFVNWTGDATGGENPVSITIHANTSITANYTQNEYTLAVNSAHGTVTKNPDQATYHYGDVVQLTAAPESDWAFTNWSGDVSDSNKSISVTIDSNKSVTANYALNTYTISGNAGVAGAAIAYTGGSTTANDNGDYSFTVSYGWSGTVTPSKTGYTFSPASKTFASVDANQTQNFTATIITYTISGNVGVAGATITYTDGSTIADSSGNYSFSVPYGWSGTVTPSKTGVAFSPLSRDYSNILSDQTNQNFQATLPLGAFNKTSPADKASGVSTSPTLAWNTSIGAVSYEYCIDTTDNGICDGNLWRSAGVKTNIPLKGLAYAQTYYWQVRAISSAGTTYANSSSWYSFSTQPSAFNKVSPLNRSSASLTPTLNWAASTGATGYEYCIDTTSGSTCDGTWTNVGNVTSTALGPLSPSTTYYWQVRSIFAGGYSYANNAWWSFTTSNGFPVAFTKSAPTNGSSGRSTSITLIWAASTNATSYQYCIDTTNNNKCDSSWVSTGTDTSATPGGLLNGKTYYWQVQAVNAYGATDANNRVWWSFSIQPGSFSKSAPDNASKAMGRTRTLSWNASDGATSYEYCYDTTANNICDGGKWMSAGTARSVILTFRSGLTYYWQVRAVYSNGPNATKGYVYADSTSEWWKFTTTP